MDDDVPEVRCEIQKHLGIDTIVIKGNDSVSFIIIKTSMEKSL